MSIRLLAIGLLFVPAAALAHPGHGSAGLSAGFLHPLLGLDHLLAMVGIGFWAAQRRNVRKTGVISAAFLAAMLVGFGLGLGQELATVVEFGILGSVLIVGALLLGAGRLSLAAAAVLAALFALCHGYAHGVEMAAGMSAVQFGFGFALAGAGLLGAGAGLAHLARRRDRKRSVECGVSGSLLSYTAYLLIVA